MGACFESPDEVLNMEYLGKRGKLLIVSVWCKGDREFEGPELRREARPGGHSPRPLFGSEVSSPGKGMGFQGGRKTHKERGGQGMEPKKGAREGLVREGERREAARRG